MNTDVNSGGGGTHFSVWYRCAAQGAEQSGLWTDYTAEFGTLVN